MKILVIIVLIITLLASCDKIEIPDPGIDGIPFGLTGTLDGQPLSIGLEGGDFVLETSAHFSENDSIWLLGGSLESRNSEGPSLQIVFRYEKKGRQLSNPPQEFFARNAWIFYDQDGIAKKQYPLLVRFEPEDSLKFTQIEVADLPARDYVAGGLELLPDRPDNLRLCAQYDTHAGLNGRFCSYLVSGLNGYQPVADWSIVRQTTDSVILSARLTNGVNTNFQFSWEDSGIFSNLSQHTVYRPGNYRVIVRKEDGSTYSHRKELRRDGETDSYLTSENEILIHTQWKNPVFFNDFVQRGTVSVSYTDEQGKVYQLAGQRNADSEFRIIDRKNYRMDRMGNPTMALLLSFSCLLADEDGNLLELSEVVGWFGVGIPK